MELLIIIAILAAPAIIPGIAHLCFWLILSKESQKQSSPLQEDDNLGFKITAMILLSIPPYREHYLNRDLNVQQRRRTNRLGSYHYKHRIFREWNSLIQILRLSVDNPKAT